MIAFFFKGQRVIEIFKESKFKYFVLEDGSKHKREDVFYEIDFLCDECGGLSRVTPYASLLKREKYFCKKCLSSGEKNPFFGKTHNKKTKEKISKAQTGRPSPMKGKKVENPETLRKIRESKKHIDFRGEKNPFYGKRHPQKTMDQILGKMKEWRDSITPEQKEEISKKLSESQKKLRAQNPEKYRESKSKAGRAAMLSLERFKKNKLELDVEKKLVEMGLISFEYSVILGFLQFDFGWKGHRVLLEVHGDYWHCNPKIYEKPKNEVQRKKLIMDEQKKAFAEEHGFKLFILWEKDFREGNFEVLEQIREILKNEI